MAKTLKNGLIMIEMNPLNHIWSHLVTFRDFVGVDIAPVSKKTAVKCNYDFNLKGFYQIPLT